MIALKVEPKFLQVSVLFFLLMAVFCGNVRGAATTEEISRWLDSHNQYRSQHQVDPVSWSTEVAASAQAYADTCPTGHSQSGYGENLAWGYPSIESVVTAWYDEETDYDYNDPGFSSGTGHFTQVVWKGTTEIGCALTTDCPSWSRTWVCQYNPPGNYIGQFAENVFPIYEAPPPVNEPTGGSSNSFVAVINFLLKD